jgi:FkbM family methyltransferase
MENFREEMRYEYDLDHNSIVIDCGGFEGRFTQGINERYHCLIHVMEPVPVFHAAIAKRFAGNMNIFVHLAGIAAETRMATFKIKGDMTGENADQGEEVEVQLTGVRDLVNYFGPRKISLIKLNIESAEFEVIEKLLDSGDIIQFENIQVQWHPLVPDYQARYDSIQERLKATHELTFDHGWVWQNWRARS